MEPRRGRLGARTLPWRLKKKDENLRCLRVFWYVGCVWERNWRDERENFPKTTKKIFYFLFFWGKMRGLGAFILEKFPFGFRRPLATLLTLAILAFSRFTSDVYLKAFLDSDWVDLSVLGKLWMSCFHKTKEIENPTVGSKVMASGTVLMYFSRFSIYLNCFNFDFDQRIVVGKEIW